MKDVIEQIKIVLSVLTSFLDKIIVLEERVINLETSSVISKTSNPVSFDQWEWCKNYQFTRFELLAMFDHYDRKEAGQIMDFIEKEKEDGICCSGNWLSIGEFHIKPEDGKRYSMKDKFDIEHLIKYGDGG